MFASLLDAKAFDFSQLCAAWSVSAAGDTCKLTNDFPIRYLKSVFPKAEETYLLDLLSNANNNVSEVTQQLLTDGYQKKDPQPLTPRKSLLSPSTQSLISRTEPTKMEIPSPKRQFRSIAEKLVGEKHPLLPQLNVVRKWNVFVDFSSKK